MTGVRRRRTEHASHRSPPSPVFRSTGCQSSRELEETPLRAKSYLAGRVGLLGRPRLPWRSRRVTRPLVVQRSTITCSLATWAHLMVAGLDFDGGDLPGACIRPAIVASDPAVPATARGRGIVTVSASRSGSPGVRQYAPQTCDSPSLTGATSARQPAQPEKIAGACSKLERQRSSEPHHRCRTRKHKPRARASETQQPRGSEESGGGGIRTLDPPNDG